MSKVAFHYCAMHQLRSMGGTIYVDGVHLQDTNKTMELPELRAQLAKDMSAGAGYEVRPEQVTITSLTRLTS